MEKRVYLSALLVVALIAAGIAIIMAMGRSDAAAVPEGASSFPEYSAGDLPPRGIVSRADVFDSPEGGGTFSGDDAYDPAAGGLAVLMSAGDVVGATFSGDDAYDPAAGALVVLMSAGDVVGATFSGDDAYDPATGALAVLRSAGDVVGASYSGDDAYDPAADGLAVLMFAGDVTGATFSGDDAYDPAAGGVGVPGEVGLAIFSGGSEFGVCPMGALLGIC
jgi:hypothetical protein